MPPQLTAAPFMSSNMAPGYGQQMQASEVIGSSGIAECTAGDFGCARIRQQNRQVVESCAIQYHSESCVELIRVAAVSPSKRRDISIGKVGLLLQSATRLHGEELNSVAKVGCPPGNPDMPRV
jgi:hypothetical protein